jgi:acyl-[acyl-carrier-protein]-phospholipid O-acyltransferase / long-chain-fatty-acid--[acyl-carrier-protein] ligase
VFAVTGVPDEKKGERIVVLHTLQEHQVVRVLEYLQASDLPALWKPKPNAFIRVEQIPYLGTGKVDLRRLKETAHALSRDPD